MKLWVDDIRNAPDDTWTVARTITSATNILRQFGVDEISLDHDISHQVGLGELSRPFPCTETFMPVVDYLIQCHHTARAAGSYLAMVITIHTANPVAAKEMVARFNAVGIQPIVAPMGAANRLELEV